MHKYILAATSHLLDSAQDARSEIFRAINGKRKKDVEEVFDRIMEVTENALEIWQTCLFTVFHIHRLRR